jgi:Fe-Mn family superoxide dismutase
MAHLLPKLPYPYDALEPHIDARTMEIHHQKHHGGYVKKLNAALEGHEELKRHSLNDLLFGLSGVPVDVREAVRNNAGGHFNHSLFWKLMRPDAAGQPQGRLREVLEEFFGSVDDFRARFTEAALGRFGSGWAWLSVGDGKLLIESTPNQDNPLMDGRRPILGLDVWEHAYYLKYQNRRQDYVDAWWNVVDWEQVAKNLEGVGR